MEHHWTPQTQNDFFDNNIRPTPQSFSPPQSRLITPISPRQTHDQDNTLNEIKVGFSKIMQTMERLEQRLNRVEQTTTQILKNQQEVLQVPFISQGELDQARKAAEQLERDTTVAKQLQAAFNKETEVKRTIVTYQNSVGQCPICGARINGMDLEAHVDQCLLLFSNDPKKEVEVKETKKKVEQGFFSRLYKTSSKTKVVTTQGSQSSQSTPLLARSGDQEGMMVNSSNYYPPPFGYPSYPHGSPQSQHPPMMMPMYMYPSYPHIGPSNE